MSFDVWLDFATAAMSLALAVLPLLGRQRANATLGFAVGMIVLAAQSIFDGLSLAARTPLETARWQTFALGAKACLPVVWIHFSLIYSRGNYREFLHRWRLPLFVTALIPLGWLGLLTLGTGLVSVESLSDAGSNWWGAYSDVARILVALLLVGSALILANLEKTFRSAVGVTQWRIKFMVLGLGIIFGVRIYTLSQALLFSGHHATLLVVDAGALLIGCLLMMVACVRQGMGEIDVYPSRAVLQSSVMVLLVGGYLFVVGVLAQIAAWLGEARHFQAQVFVVLLGVTVLLVLFFSDRVRQSVGSFVSRHFQRPQHDYRNVWTMLTRRMFEARDEPSLCTATAEMISETLRVLSVTLWVTDESQVQFRFVASTSPLARATADALPGRALPASASIPGATDAELRSKPFDLEAMPCDWADTWRQANPRQFAASGGRLCVPLVTGERRVGMVVLADRVNSVPYTAEELELLECMGDQVAAGLLNQRLTDNLMQAREMEAFQTMSTFFVHDLKNTAASLGLMLENLPVHFDDPGFRADALRGIGTTVGRINYLIERLGVLRRKLEARPTPLDLNQLVAEALDMMPGAPGVEIRRELRPLPQISADREQIQSVLTNLVLNARDSLECGGYVQVETSQRDQQVVLAVIDDGCGMSPSFVRDSLFRPFHTTKKKGLGIGMFQSKMMVEANRGTIQVESVVGKGTTFRVSLPLIADVR